MALMRDKAIETFNVPYRQNCCSQMSEFMDYAQYLVPTSVPTSTHLPANTKRTKDAAVSYQKESSRQVIIRSDSVELRLHL